MADREELKSLIDRLPEASLDMVRTMMQFHINPPPPPPPEVERLRRRGQEYRRAVEQRFRETLKPGTIAGFGGGGHSGIHEGTAFGHNSFDYWDGKALVRQTLQSYDTQDIEIMETFSYTTDGAELLCNIELSSGGRTVKHEETFPRTNP
jgi:hypothetical protein